MGCDVVQIKDIEAPDNCIECLLEQNNKCLGTAEHRRVEPIDRPEWCPLEETKDEVKA